MNKKDITVQKASGETEPFSIEKLKNSLHNAGASEEEKDLIAEEISEWIFDGISTHDIYARAYSLLQQKKYYLASRYKLKKAILELGPTGYPFEHFVSKIFEARGFNCKTGQIMNGCCITHEVDVVAVKEKEEHLAECKYSQSQDKTVNVQVPLYVRSRMNDIFYKQKESLEYQEFSFFGWVITNTRFSLDAIAYGKCCGLNLLSWDYPLGKGMKDIIDSEKIYPVTVLSCLTTKQKQILLEHNIVICRQIPDNKELIKALQLDHSQFKCLMEELQGII